MIIHSLGSLTPLSPPPKVSPPRNISTLHCLRDERRGRGWGS